MADVRDRDGKEAGLVKPIAREFNRFLKQIMGVIPGLEPLVTSIAPEYWNEHEQNLRSGIAPVLGAVFVDQAETMIDDDFEYISVEWGLVNEEASAWAADYSYKLVTDLTKTSKKALQRIIPRFFDEQWSNATLRSALSTVFGGRRAETIAITEITRAASEAEVVTSRLLIEQGINLIPIWKTSRDEIVCEICRPLDNAIGYFRGDNRPEWEHPAGGTYGPPPAHVNCRCGWAQRTAE
jgi:hypothetical protein